MPILTVAYEQISALTLVKTFFSEEKSNSDIRRLFEQDAISCNEEKLTADVLLTPKSGDIWQIGKRTWFKIG
jgi:hypothetical protein